MSMTTGMSTTMTQAYGEPWYWDNRYANESGTFDWYQKYQSLAPLVNFYVPRHHRILIVGCGNLAFSQGMADDGYEDVVNIDISAIVIEAMQKKYSNRAGLKYMKMDVRDMSAFQTCCFNAIIDKGTLDSLLCGNNSRQNATKMLEEVWRVLKDNGIYIMVTYGAPMHRLSLLKHSFFGTTKLHVIEKLVSEESSESTNSVRELTKPIPMDNDGNAMEEVLVKDSDVHYIYVCTKDNSSK